MPKPSILVCDDEASLRAAVRLILERDYEVRFAVDGDDALKQFERQPADLVLLDIKMPKRDGLDVLKILMTTQPPPRVLMLTAYQSLELAQRATQSGAIDYVTKPFSRATLLKAVERALSRPSGPFPTPSSSEPHSPT